MKICFIKPKDIELGYVESEWVRAFKELNISIIEVKFIDGGFSDYIKEVLEDFKPDFVITYDYLGIDKEFIFRKLKLKTILLFCNNPLIGLTKEFKNELEAYPEYYHSFLPDRLWIKYFLDEGIGNVEYLPPAADTTNYYPINDLVAIKDICLMGAVNSSYSRLNTGSEIVDEFLDNAIDMKLSNFDASIMEICEDLFNVNYYRIFQQLYNEDRQSFWSKVYSYINIKGSTIFRNYILQLTKPGKINLYGADITNNGNFIYHPNLLYGIECSMERQKYKINLNISPLHIETGIDNNIINSFACGSFILTDYKKELEYLIPDYFDIITYKTIEELNNKIEYYLSHEYERMKITKEINYYIIKNYTYDNAAKSILEKIL